MQVLFARHRSNIYRGQRDRRSQRPGEAPAVSAISVGLGYTPPLRSSLSAGYRSRKNTTGATFVSAATAARLASGSPVRLELLVGNVCR